MAKLTKYVVTSLVGQEGLCGQKNKHREGVFKKVYAL
jgi:hypothetical protein